MTNYREILRLRSLGINYSRIADSMGIARQTVVTALQRAAAQGLDWQAAEAMSDRELVANLFPAKVVVYLFGGLRWGSWWANQKTSVGRLRRKPRHRYPALLLQFLRGGFARRRKPEPSRASAGGSADPRPRYLPRRPP